MSEQVERTCILCSHFYWSPPESDYSDVTPGSWGAVGCCYNDYENGIYGLWYMSEEPDNWKLEEYREHMLKAQTCPHFQHYKEEQGADQPDDQA